MKKSLSEQLASVRRELELRKRCYPKWLAERRPNWTADKVRHEIECMEAIAESLDRLKMLEEVSNDMFNRATQQIGMKTNEPEDTPT